MKLKVIACNVMWRELAYHAALSPHAFHLEFLDWGLHIEPNKLRECVQASIDAVDPTFDAILLGYGLCSNGLDGITARNTRLVLFRGHDCITCFLGSKERYREYFDAHPGTYWYTPGWIENHLAPGPDRYETIYQQYVQTYGEENARYLMEMEQDWFHKYTTATYVDLGVGDTDAHEAYTRECANWLQWEVDRLKGDPSLMVRMVNGAWNDQDFLVVEPGFTIRASNDPGIVTAVYEDPTP